MSKCSRWWFLDNWFLAIAASIDVNFDEGKRSLWASSTSSFKNKDAKLPSQNSEEISVQFIWDLATQADELFKRNCYQFFQKNSYFCNAILDRVSVFFQNEILFNDVIILFIALVSNKCRLFYAFCSCKFFFLQLWSVVEVSFYWMLQWLLYTQQHYKYVLK
jgi:hypothetical protein